MGRPLIYLLAAQLLERKMESMLRYSTMQRASDYQLLYLTT